LLVLNSISVELKQPMVGCTRSSLATPALMAIPIVQAGRDRGSKQG
jgi:hypothetical protein